MDLQTTRQVWAYAHTTRPEPVTEAEAWPLEPAMRLAVRRAKAGQLPITEIPAYADLRDARSRVLATPPEPNSVVSPDTRNRTPRQHGVATAMPCRSSLMTLTPWVKALTAGLPTPTLAPWETHTPADLDRALRDALGLRRRRANAAAPSSAAEVMRTLRRLLAARARRDGTAPARTAKGRPAKAVRVVPIPALAEPVSERERVAGVRLHELTHTHEASAAYELSDV